MPAERRTTPPFTPDARLQSLAKSITERWLEELIPHLLTGNNPWSRDNLTSIEDWLTRQNIDELWAEFPFFLGEGLRRRKIGYWSNYPPTENPTIESHNPGSPRAVNSPLAVLVKYDGSGVVPVSNWAKFARDEAVPITAADLFHEVGLTTPPAAPPSE